MAMGCQLPRSAAVLVPAPAPASQPQAVAGLQPVAAPVLPVPLNDITAETLRQTDENLKKRIIALATKVSRTGTQIQTFVLACVFIVIILIKGDIL